MSIGIARPLRSLRAASSDRHPTAGALVAATVTLVVMAVAVGLATRTGREVEVAGLAIALLAVLISLRWPLLPLFAFVVLIPFEAVLIEGFGSLVRSAELLFIVTYGIPRLGRLALGAMPKAGWAYVAWAVFSATWALDAATSWVLITPLLLAFTIAVLMGSAVVERPTLVRPVLWAYSLSAAASAVLAIISFLVAGGLAGPNDRVTGLAGQDPAFWAAFLVPALVFAIHELLYPRWIVPSALVVIVCTIGIVISGTRGAWVSALVVLAIFVLPRLDPRRAVAAVAVVLALVVVTLQIPGIASFVNERTDTAIASGGAGRTDIWAVGLRIFGSAPWTGVGLNNFPLANTPERARDAPLSIVGPDGVANLQAHNIVIGTLGELGVVGIVLLIALLGPLVIRRGWGPEGAVVQAALASLLVMGLFLDVLASRELWFFIGLACGLAYLASRETARRGPAARQPTVRVGAIPAIPGAVPRREPVP